MLCGLALGVCVLIRESGIFLIPALILLIGASRLRLPLFAGSFLAFCILVWAPLNAARPPVATTSLSGSAGNSEAFRSVLEGRVPFAVQLLARRAERNLMALPGAGYEQLLSLCLLMAVPRREGPSMPPRSRTQGEENRARRLRVRSMPWHAAAAKQGVF